MYQYWQAQEQSELWLQENQPVTDAERQKAEVIEEWENDHPSLFQRIISIFRPDPEVDTARTQLESEVIVAFGAEEYRSRLS